MVSWRMLNAVRIKGRMLLQGLCRVIVWVYFVVTGVGSVFKSLLNASIYRPMTFRALMG